MRLFSTDLFRNFGIGFALGAVLVIGSHAREWGVLESSAQAAEQIGVPTPTSDFVIAPEQG